MLSLLATIAVFVLLGLFIKSLAGPQSNSTQASQRPSKSKKQSSIANSTPSVAQTKSAPIKRPSQAVPKEKQPQKPKMTVKQYEVSKTREYCNSLDIQSQDGFSKGIWEVIEQKISQFEDSGQEHYLNEAKNFAASAHDWGYETHKFFERGSKCVWEFPYDANKHGHVEKSILWDLWLACARRHQAQLSVSHDIGYGHGEGYTLDELDCFQHCEFYLEKHNLSNDPMTVLKNWETLQSHSDSGYPFINSCKKFFIHNISLENIKQNPEVFHQLYQYLSHHERTYLKGGALAVYEDTLQPG